MTGVEILSQEVVYNNVFPELLVGLLFVIGGFCFATLLMNGSEMPNKLCCGLVIGTLLSLVLVGIGFIDNKNSIDHIEYKVTISDDVSLTEFYEKYEIIEQDGKIYTVKERTE